MSLPADVNNAPAARIIAAIANRPLVKELPVSLAMGVVAGSGLFSAAFYRQHAKELEPLDEAGLLRHYFEIGEAKGWAASGLFNACYYLARYPDVRVVDSLIYHFVSTGRGEGRIGSLAADLVRRGLDRTAVDLVLIPDPGPASAADYLDRLARALEACNQTRNYFSNAFYIAEHPDVAAAGVAPLMHYLEAGVHEKRLTNMALLSALVVHDDRIDASKPFILVGVHEASKTGAPIVGLDLGLALRTEYNVIFVMLGDGPLVETAQAEFPISILCSMQIEHIRFVIADLVDRFPFDRAICSSVVCEPLVRMLAVKDVHVTCLVHEFLEYMIPMRSLAFFADLLVFSSRELLKSWQTLLDDGLRPLDSVIVLPQPASQGTKRALSRPAARAEVERQTGIDLSDATLVLGAGQVQIRKGTDIFVQIGNQLQREAGKFVSIWIGEQASEFELHYGVYLHAQIARSTKPGVPPGVHFQPPGPLYPILMDAADVFLLTSRLDPLPNVAIEAAARGTTVVAFRGATGLADLAESGAMNLIEVEFGAVDEAIAAIRTASSQLAEQLQPARSGASRQAGAKTMARRRTQGG